jgi:hypothetical protein
VAVQQAPRTIDTPRLAAHGDVGAPASLRGWMVLGLGAAIASAYAIAYPLLGTAYPLGWDSPVYVWWSRVAETAGLSSPLIGARPGSVGVVAVLAATLHVQTSTVVAALMLTALAAASLAGAALVNQCLGPDRLRFVLVAVLLAAGMWVLAAGYLSTLMFAAEFLAAMVLIVRDRSTLAAGAAGLLLGAAGAAHPLFMVWTIAVIVPALVAVRLWARPSSRAFMARALASLVIGGLVTGLAVVVTGGLHAGALEFSRDGMLKSVGLGSLSLPFHREKMLLAAPFFLFSAACACLSLTCRARLSRWWSGPREAPRLFAGGVAVAWVGGTLLAGVLLLLSVPAPAQRLVIFCLPLPMLAGIGAAAVLKPRPAGAEMAASTSRARRVMVALAMLAIWLGVGIAAQGWLVEAKGSVVSRHTLLVERTVAAATAATPAGTPVVVVIDGRDDRVIAKTETLLRSSIQPSRVEDVRFFVGSRTDFETGRVRVVGVPERDRIARRHAAEIEPLLRAHTLVLSIGRTAGAATLWKRLGNSVLVLERPGLAVVGPADIRRAEKTTEFPAVDVHPGLPLLLALVLTLVLGLIGRAATRFLSGEEEETSYALAPAAGIAVVMAAAVATSVAGVGLTTVLGQVVVACVVLGLVGIGAMAGNRRAPRSPIARALERSVA